jgi:hypothetical protein
LFNAPPHWKRAAPSFDVTAPAHPPHPPEPGLLLGPSDGGIAPIAAGFAKHNTPISRSPRIRGHPIQVFAVDAWRAVPRRQDSRGFLTAQCHVSDAVAGEGDRERIP